ncbi:MAG TPA: alcohol dehydrogenase catalytic domain-containing protein [Candidatus Onthousia faecigallinarum]|nr:alcohol dehydrogenase catalytic domain-containing protein [Candidatus Onthousia faecigallinarum]
MKAIAIKGVREFEMKEIEKPVEAKDGYVLIDVKKSGICGSDLHYFEAGGPVGLIMGHEFSGVVVDPGTRTDLKVGDRVTGLPISPCGKCHACLTGNPQYCLETWNQAVGLSPDHPGGLTSRIFVREDMVLKLPDSVSFEEGAMVEPTAVGLHAVHLADIRVGAKVLVIGGGIIGLVSAMFAKKEGASYVALSETNEARGKKALTFGVADEYFDAKNQKVIEEMVAKTEGGFDVVIECCGNSAAVSSALMAVKPGGCVILVGVSLTPVTIPTVLSVMRELTVKGAIGYTKEEFASVIDLMANKQIEVLKFVSEEVGLEGIQAAYEKLTSGTSEEVKILVDPNK